MNKKLGRPLKTEQIKKALKYRKAGLSYREIAGALKSDVKTVYRWINSYAVGKTVNKSVDTLAK